MNKKELIIFALLNVALIALAVVFWIVPAVGSLRSGREGVRLLESEYMAQRVLLEKHEDNLREIEETTRVRRILTYEEMLPALAEISTLGKAYGLNKLEFTAFEIDANMVDVAGISRILEMRVRAEYEGELGNTLDFLRNFAATYGNVRSFSVIIKENVRLNLEFSLFGSE